MERGNRGGCGAPLWEVRLLGSGCAGLGFLQLLGQHRTPSPAVPGAAFAWGRPGRGAGAGHSPEHPWGQSPLALERVACQAGGDAARWQLLVGPLPLSLLLGSSGLCEETGGWAGCPEPELVSARL